MIEKKSVCNTQSELYQERVDLNKDGKITEAEAKYYIHDEDNMIGRRKAFFLRLSKQYPLTKKDKKLIYYNLLASIQGIGKNKPPSTKSPGLIDSIKLIKILGRMADLGFYKEALKQVDSIKWDQHKPKTKYKNYEIIYKHPDYATVARVVITRSVARTRNYGEALKLASSFKKELCKEKAISAIGIEMVQKGDLLQAEGLLKNLKDQTKPKNDLLLELSIAQPAQARSFLKRIKVKTLEQALEVAFKLSIKKYPKKMIMGFVNQGFRAIEAKAKNERIILAEDIYNSHRLCNVMFLIKATKKEILQAFRKTLRLSKHLKNPKKRRREIFEIIRDRMYFYAKRINANKPIGDDRIMYKLLLRAYLNK